MLKKFLYLMTAVVATVSIAACDEKLEGGTSCPLLCPQQSVSLKDTTFEGILVDTTVSGLPTIGTEPFTMLASFGDTIDTRVIIRYDTLPTTYTKGTADSAITKIDTAQLVAPIALADSGHRPTAPVTIEVYNVDTTATDTVAAILAPLFRPSRLLGSKTFAPESLKDTLRIPISPDTVLDRVQKGTKLRVGLKLVSTQGVSLRLSTARAGTPVRLVIKASTDTAATPVSVVPFSLTPADEPFLSEPLADYTLVVKGATVSPPTILGVGGVPSRRVFFKFSVPSHIVDSTSIVRASLILTQTPNRRVAARDSLFVFPVPILSTSVVTDYKSALQFLGSNGQFGLDSLKLAPGDSGVRSFEIVGLVRTWRQQPETVSPRTLALRLGDEGSVPGEIDFFSTNALAGLRPKLRITYVPATSFGLP
ncbi:MAG TPA: hypothetical protein VIP11_01610 [Gemmatimonadaceae bacterium]